MKKNLVPYTQNHQINQFIAKLITSSDVDLINEITQYSYSRNSLLAICNDWKRFVLFCHQRQVKPIPASITALRQFIDKESQVRKFSSIRRSTVHIGLIHNQLSQPNPVNHRIIKFTLNQLKQSVPHQESSATPMTREHLNHFDKKFSVLPHNELSTKTVRDIAICYVMFECMLKRSELKLLTHSHLQHHKDGIRLSVSDNTYQLSQDAIKWLTLWLERQQFESMDNQVLFTGIDRHGNLSTQALDDSSIYRVVRSMGDRLGIPNMKPMSSQSTRIGGAKELRKQGMKIREIQEFGRWLSPAMPSQYAGLKHKAELEKLEFTRFIPWD